MIEYALLAVVISLAATAILPNVSTSISQIFSKVGSVLSGASTQGS